MDKSRKTNRLLWFLALDAAENAIGPRFIVKVAGAVLSRLLCAVERLVRAQVCALRLCVRQKAEAHAHGYVRVIRRALVGNGHSLDRASELLRHAFAARLTLLPPNREELFPADTPDIDAVLINSNTAAFLRILTNNLTLRYVWVN